MAKQTPQEKFIEMTTAPVERLIGKLARAICETYR